MKATGWGSLRGRFPLSIYRPIDRVHRCGHLIRRGWIGNCHRAELETLLAGIVAAPERASATLPLLPPAELELLAQWQQPQASFPDGCIHHLFAAQVQRTPTAIAHGDRGCQLTYQELDRRANLLAHQLRAAGVRPEVLVGISLERTAQMLVAILGIWKAGGADVPLDPTYPRDRGDAQPTIGRPSANTQIQLLDAHQQPVPIGIAGEIYISGAGVARGYLERPELTAARFDRPAEGNWRYRTGDLGRYLADGRIEYLQRIDNQVKLRGSRIELGEIEATIALDPAVQAAVAMVREDSPDERVLVGYVVLARGADAETAMPQLRELLKGRLPDYLVPPVLMAIESLPLTPNGKVDRRALPIPDRQRQVVDRYVSPSTEIERQIVAIWEGVMKIDRVGVDDNFFDLGGYSLLAIQVMARLRQTLRIEIGLSSLFELPTVAGLANRIETWRWAAQSRQIPQRDLTVEEEEGEL